MPARIRPAPAKDPARIAKLLADLNAPTEEERYAARVDLRAAGDNGMIAAVHALAEAKDETTRGNLLAALADMQPAIEAPLLALLPVCPVELPKMSVSEPLEQATIMTLVVSANDATRNGFAFIGPGGHFTQLSPCCRSMELCCPGR